MFMGRPLSRVAMPMQNYRCCSKGHKGLAGWLAQEALQEGRGSRRCDFSRASRSAQSSPHLTRRGPVGQEIRIVAADQRPLRKIIHVDMDAFYASVEQRDDPDLRGKPVAVGGGHRGVVAAASYEARPFGVRSALPSVTARRLCPELIFVKTRFDVYRAVSQQIRAIFGSYTDLVEPLSLDEGYLDVTEDRLALGTARAIAEDIRRRIREDTQLTASAGVSYC